MKDKAAVIFRRPASGDVFGEIINDKGVLVECKTFEVMTEKEYKKVLKLTEQEYPDIASCKPIELTGN